jgi:hypothetical protein
MKTLIWLVCGWTGLTGALKAGQVFSTSYDMPNGDSGTYHYWDASYTGSGNPLMDRSYLSGGHGILTDGIIPTQPASAYGADYPNGPYVGWFDGNGNPTIVFHFASVVNISDVTINVDDSSAFSPPEAVKIQEGSGGLSWIDPLPFTTITGPPAAFSFPVSFTGDELDLTLDINKFSGWVYLSEVTFFNTPNNVPDRGLTLAMLGMAMALLAFIHRKLKD